MRKKSQPSLVSNRCLHRPPSKHQNHPCLPPLNTTQPTPARNNCRADNNNQRQHSTSPLGSYRSPNITASFRTSINHLRSAIVRLPPPIAQLYRSPPSTTLSVMIITLLLFFFYVFDRVPVVVVYVHNIGVNLKEITEKIEKWFKFEKDRS